LSPERRRIAVQHAREKGLSERWACQLTGQRNQALLIMRAFCSEFGLTPISRTRLSVENPGEEEDDLMALLSQPRTNRRIFPEAG